MKLDYTSKDVDIHIDVPEAHKSREDLDFMLLRVADDCLSHRKDLLTKDLDIEVTDISDGSDQITYKIDGHSFKISLKTFDKKGALDSIVKRELVHASPFKTPDNIKSFLQRFTRRETPGFFSNFLNLIKRPFTALSTLWSGITGASDEKFKWDLKLLNEVCDGTPIDGMTLTESLEYMHKLLKQERLDISNPAIEARIETAFKTSKKLDVLRENFSEKEFNSISKDLQENVPELIPVGYYSSGRRVEMLLEVTEEGPDTYTVTLISSDEDVQEYFSKVLGEEISYKNTKREIRDVKKNDLVGRIPQFIELYTAPHCQNHGTADLNKTLFFEQLLFDGSEVTQPLPEKRFIEDKTPGTFLQVIDYVAGTKSGDDSERFTLAVKIKAFLDVTSAHPEGYKKYAFWSATRNTAYELAHEIEKNMELLGDESEQQAEIMQLEAKLREVIDLLESTPPEFNLSVVEGVSNAETTAVIAPVARSEEVRPLYDLAVKYPKVKNKFELFNRKDITGTLQSWNRRLGQLPSEFKEREKHLMICALPEYDDPIWPGFEDTQLLERFAPKCDAHSATESWINLLKIEATIEKCGGQHSNDTAKLAKTLMKCKLSQKNQVWIKRLSQVKASRSLNKRIPKNIHFIKLPYRYHPSDRVLKAEVGNRYATEFCCLGCIRDNCPNYNMRPKEIHRAHPLFMLHNYPEKYFKKLLNEIGLHRDEVTDLLYTQQLQRNAYDVLQAQDYNYSDDFAYSFDSSEYQMQLKNAVMVYLNHPDFFHNPMLRRHFERKLFTQDALSSLMTKENVPFLVSMTEKIKAEIHASYTGKDRDITSFLLSVSDKILSTVESSKLSSEDQEKITQNFSYDPMEKLISLAKETIPQVGDVARRNQDVMLPIVLNNYYERLCSNLDDPCFSNEDDLEVICSSLARMRMNLDVGEKFFIEDEVRYEVLMSHVLNKLEGVNPKDFASKVLQQVLPELLESDPEIYYKDFPLITFIDKTTKNVSCFDLCSGSLTGTDIKISLLPKSVRENSEFIKFLGPLAKDTWNVFVPKTAGGKKRIKEVYRHSARKDVTLMHTKDGYQLRRAQSNGEIVTLLPVSELKPYLTPQMLQFIGDRACWVDKDRTRVEVLDGMDLYATVNLKMPLTEGGPGFRRVRKIKRFEDKKFLLSPDKSTTKWFCSIESSSQTLFLGKGGKIDEIQFPRLSLISTGEALQYSIKSGALQSSSFEGYTLQPLGHYPGKSIKHRGVATLPPTFDHFHLLENDGKEKVLIPQGKLMQAFSSNGKKLPHLNMEFPEDNSPLNLLEFNVNNETGRLDSSSGEGYAYLAYLFMAHGDYESALYYNRKSTTVKGYSAAYSQILDWVEDYEDLTANGAALKLHMAFLREKVIDDKRMLSMESGDLKAVSELDNNRNARLRNIARCYEVYCSSSDLDPNLKLDDKTLIFMQARLEEHVAAEGSSSYDYGEFKVVSAKASSLPPRTNSTSKEVALGINATDVLLWVRKVNVDETSPLTFKDPKWILDSYPSTFNKILYGDPSSAEFLSLAHKIETLREELSTSDFTEEEYEALKELQLNLMKLIEAKKEYPTLVQEIKDALPKGKIPEIASSHGKTKRGKLMDELVKRAEMFSEAALRSVPLALDSIEVDYEDTWNILGIVYNFLTDDYFDIDDKEYNPSLRKFLKASKKFIHRYEKKNPGAPLDDAFINFISEYHLGGKDAQMLRALSGARKALENVQVSAPIQYLSSAPTLKPKSHETVEAHYAPILKNLSKKTKIEGIDDLEKAVYASTCSTPPAHVHTDRTEYTPVFVAGLTAAFQVTDDTSLADSVSREIFTELKASEEPAFVRLATEHEKDMQAYLDEQKVVATISTKDGKDLKTKLENQKELLEETIKENEKDLLQFLERFDTPASLLAIKRLTGSSVKPNIEHLVQMWRRRELSKESLEKLKIRNVPQKEIEELNQNVERLLKDSTELKMVERALSAASNFTDPSKTTELYEMLSTMRSYSMSDPDARDFLFTEYSLGIVLRESQVLIIRSMDANLDNVEQQPMGGGKSKVILPLLAKRRARGDNLVAVVLPEELIETNCADLNATNKILFGQEMARFDFSRDSDTSVEALKLQYKVLLETVQNKGYVMSTRKSLIVFRNTFIERFRELQLSKGEQKNLHERVQLMAKILKLFDNRSELIADEADAILDIRKEVNSSLGESELLQKELVDRGFTIYSDILTSEDPRVIPLKEALLLNTHATLPDSVKAGAFKAIAEKLYDTFEGVQFSKEQFNQYMLDEAQDQVVENWVKALKTKNHDLFVQVATTRGMITKGMMTSFNRTANVNYGRDPISKKWTIPFKASDTPIVGSIFDSPTENLAFIYQDYMQNGVERILLSNEVAKLYNEAMREIKSADADTLLSIQDTDAQKAFQDLLKKLNPENKLGGNFTLINATTPTGLNRLLKIVNETPQSRLDFCHRFVASTMTQYRLQVNAVSMDLVEMCAHLGGFTGTPRNRHAFHDRITANKTLGVDGRSWALVLGRDVSVNTFDFDPENQIESIVSGGDIVRNYQAFIDAGALLRGTDNKAFIDHCLDMSAKAGIYFDKSGRIVKHQSGDDKPQPIETAKSTELASNMTLYDQSHVVGADIKQAAKARALISVEDTTVRDFFQGIWRLRQLHQGQGVDVLCTNQLAEQISPESEVKIQEIMKFLLLNEMPIEAEDNFRAEKERISGFTKRRAFSAIVNALAGDISKSEALKLSQAFATDDNPLFYKIRPGDEILDEYVATHDQVEPSVVFDRLKKAEAKKCSSLASKPTVISGVLREGAEIISGRKSPPKEMFMSKVSSGSSAAGEVEVENEVAVEVEVEVQTETLTEVQVETETVIPKAHNASGGSGEVNPLQVDDIKQKDHLRKVSHSIPFFDSEIYCSDVFERNLNTKSRTHLSPQAVFYTNRKPVQQAMIHERNGNLEMIFPTTHEAHGACTEYVNQFGGIVFALVPGTPLTLAGNIPVGHEKRFYELYVQAKLFKGLTDFNSKEEKEALKSWLTKVGAKDFKAYFEQNILASGPKRIRDRYQKSSLYKTFNEVVVN